jgi:hypothetical protein
MLAFSILLHAASHVDLVSSPTRLTVPKYGQQAALLCVRFNCIAHSTVTRCVVSACERRSLVGQSTLLVPNAARRRPPTLISKCFGDTEYTRYVDYEFYYSTIISHTTIGR